MLKGINKCIEKENGHKHRGFYSECCDADESPECTWRAKLRESGTSQESSHGSRVGPGSACNAHTDLGTIYLHGSYYISNIVFILLLQGLGFLPTMKQIKQPPPAFFNFQCGLARFSRFSANNTAGLRPLFERLIGCCLSREAISEVSVTAGKKKCENKAKRRDHCHCYQLAAAAQLR